jgi:hypothetical protein
VAKTFYYVNGSETKIFGETEIDAIVEGHKFRIEGYNTKHIADLILETNLLASNTVSRDFHANSITMDGRNFKLYGRPWEKTYSASQCFVCGGTYRLGYMH